MIGEIKLAAKVVANRIAYEVANETAKEMAKAEIGSVDITKRLDVGAKVLGEKKTGIDVTKRIIPEKLKNDVSTELTPLQVRKLAEKGMSPARIAECTIKDGIYRLKTINEKYVGQKHPETGVLYRKKTIDLFGTKVEGVFPKFDALYSTKLPVEKLMASDKIQFDHCIKELQSDIKKNPALKEKFTQRELAQIEHGITPSRFTWNHNEEVGKMELVDAKIHERTGHTGGKAIWGGGAEHR